VPLLSERPDGPGPPTCPSPGESSPVDHLLLVPHTCDSGPRTSTTEPARMHADGNCNRPRPPLPRGPQDRDAPPGSRRHKCLLGPPGGARRVRPAVRRPGRPATCPARAGRPARRARPGPAWWRRPGSGRGPRPPRAGRCAGPTRPVRPPDPDRAGRDGGPRHGRGGSGDRRHRAWWQACAEPFLVRGAPRQPAGTYMRPSRNCNKKRSCLTGKRIAALCFRKKIPPCRFREDCIPPLSRAVPRRSPHGTHRSRRGR
jgi:hypothetical protein